MVRLHLELDDKAQWVKVFDPRDCTLFVASDTPPGVGEEARVDLTVGNNGPRIILHGRVISRRDEPESSVPPGCSVAIGFEDREKINYLNGYVRGGLLDLRERRRLPVRLTVTYGGLDGPCSTYTRDINEEGLFVVTEDPLPEGSEVHLRLNVPVRDEAVALSGVVSHTVVVEDEDVPGMGIVMHFSDADRSSFTQMIDELEQRFQTGKLPDDCLL